MTTSNRPKINYVRCVWSLLLYSYVSQQQRVQDTLEEKLGATGCDSGNVEVQWNNIKECVLDTIWLGKSRIGQDNHGLHRK